MYDVCFKKDTCLCLPSKHDLSTHRCTPTPSVHTGQLALLQHLSFVVNALFL